MSKLNSRILIVNGSKRVSNGDVYAACGAITAQIRDQVAPAWGRQPVSVQFAADPASIAETEQVITLLDSPDTDGALGYHYETNDQVLGKVFSNPVLDNGGTALGSKDALGTPSVSSVLSHEVLELFCDPDTNLYVDGPAIDKGSCYALEICDAVEGDGYIVGAGDQDVQVSNFVTPTYFDGEATAGPFDFLGKLTGPFTLDKNGYLIVRSSPGTEAQVFGESMPAWKRELKAKVGRGAARLGK